MPTFRITAPDGKTYDVTGPEGSTADQALAQVQSQLKTSTEAPKQDSTFLGRTARDLGAGALRGAASIGATLLAPVDAAARAVGIQNDYIGRTDRRESLDPALQSLGADTDSLAYGAGKIGAEVAGTLGVGGAIANGIRGVTAAAPTAARFLNPLADAVASGGMRIGPMAPSNRLAQMALRATGGATGGAASTALVDPSATGAGAALGAALPVGAAGAGAIGQAFGRSVGVTPQGRQIGQLAQQYDIPVTAGDISGSTTKALRSVLNDLPIVGGIGAGAREQQQQAYNRAVGRTFGADEISLTPDVLDAAQGRIGKEIDRVWSGNTLQVDSGLLDTIGKLQAEARNLPSESAGSLNRVIDDFLSKAKPNAQGVPEIPGEAANEFQKYLRRRIKPNADLEYELGDLRSSIIKSFNRSVSGDDAAALTKARTQYKAFKTVEPLLEGSELGVAGRTPGNVPAGLLPGAVRNSYADPTGTALGDLSLIGSNLLTDRVARTGGSTRAAIQNTLLGTLALSNPAVAAAALPATASVNALLNSPRLGQYMLQPGSNRLLSMLQGGTPELAARAAPVILSNP